MLTKRRAGAANGSGLRRVLDGVATMDRRAFLMRAGLTAGGVAAVGLTDQAEAAVPDAKASKGRYRETAHVRRVYDLSRF